MIIKPEMPPREFDVPCIYRQTSLRRSAALMFDPFVLVSFAATAASYALEAYDSQDKITEYLQGEFARQYGKGIEVDPVFDFQGSCVAMDLIIGVPLPFSHSIEVQ